MNFFLIGMIIMQAARLACGTCVFESDFGFKLNCNFRKAGLFRVRNLGGLKAHFGLGFSVGDELGFNESLGNVEGGSRRSISYKNGPPNFVGVLPANQQTPAQHPIPDKRIASRSTGSDTPIYNRLPGRELIKKQAPARNPAPAMPLMTEARPLPLGVPAFRPIPKKVTSPNESNLDKSAQRRTSIAVDGAPNPRVRVNNKLVDSYSHGGVTANRTFHVANPVVSQPQAVPAFQAMPESISPITSSLKQSATQVEPRVATKHPNYLQFEEPKFDMKDISVDELAAAANVSVTTIKHAIYVREQQLKAEHRAMLAAKLREEFIRTSTTTTSSTTTTTTTPKPYAYIDIGSLAQQNVAYENKVSKVMNAPKEYYPVGYDKNFDDNFKSKVDLPPTSFSCNKQKHFPGLYADTDLGCMVFHVCALTDDGLVRKSFLCPENTLFDQTILKCNWWFYVDCNVSKSIYDSNIPISKSYQLMKSLTYFSKFTKNGDDSNGLDIQNLKDTMENDSRSLKENSKEGTSTESPKLEAVVTSEQTTNDA